MGKSGWIFFVAAFILLSATAHAGSWRTGGDDADADGTNDYALHCASCHGANGDGKGDLADALPVPPRDHTDASIMGQRTDGHLFKTIRDGGDSNGFDSAMPPHNTILSDGQIRGLVKHIRKLCKCAYKK